MKQHKLYLIGVLLLVVGTNLNAQINNDSYSARDKLIKLQNDFIGLIKAVGFQPSLKTPEIIMDNPPGFGN